MANKKKKKDPRIAGGRDYVTMREITHGSGTGAHKSKQDIQKKEEKKAKQRGYSDEDHASFLCLLSY